MPRSGDPSDGKKLRLTVFLIKEGYADLGEFLDAGSLQRIDVDQSGVTGTLFFKSGFISTPPWAAIFTEVSGFNARRIVNQHSRGLFVLKEHGRWFCFTFGYARQLINEAAVERNFGLIVSLNLGDPDAIKTIEKTNISHVGLQSREQASRDVAFDGFEFDTDIDLLKSMTAKGPEKEGQEQETYSGRDSFTVYTRVTLSALPDLAKKLFKAFQSTAYRRLYPWVDKIIQERDPGIVDKLDARLVDSINTADVAKIWMAIPEIVTWEDVDSFAYRVPSANPRRPGPALYPDIDLESWLGETRLRGRLTLSQLQNRKVYQCYKEAREPATWSVYRCLNAEIDLDGQKYILNDGDWYNVDRAYVSDIDSFYGKLPNSRIALPPFGALTEPKYLASVPTTHPQYALMDRKLVAIGGGRSSVEFCDLFSKTKDIIHVKQYGGSSLLSHLFNQAIVSADCFLHEPDFRQALNKRFPTGFKLTHPDAEPNPLDYTVCTAIMSKVPGPLEIPFFSKVSLKHAVKTLQRMGFKVTKLKIER